MSSYPSNEVDKDEQVDKAQKPEWLEAFLRKTFFHPCATHLSHRNELNKYCINCNLPICQYGESSHTHRQHNILKVYRHYHKDVVSITAMEKYIDCSQIQPYKCNKCLVIALKPLPHFGSTKRKEALTCNICNRVLVEPNLYNYCSISCKVEAILRKPNDYVPPFISIQSIPQEKKGGNYRTPEAAKQKKGSTP